VTVRFGAFWNTPDASVLRFVTYTLEEVKFPGQHVGSKRNRATAAVYAPMWMRWLVLFFAVLFGTVTTAQAAHVHRVAKAGHTIQAPATASQTADNEEHCPVCVTAMHAALPAPLHVASAPVLQDERLEGPSCSVGAATAWHFARFGRPPPVQA
jgi:hypothetical protein